MRHFLPLVAVVAAVVGGLLCPAGLPAGTTVIDTCTALNAGGTADLPADCAFEAPFGPMYIIDGLPPGTTIECTPLFSTFTGVIRTPGGPLGGETESFHAQMMFSMAGTGSLAGYNRIMNFAQL